MSGKAKTGRPASISPGSSDTRPVGHKARPLPQAMPGVILIYNPGLYVAPLTGWSSIPMNLTVVFVIVSLPPAHLTCTWTLPSPRHRHIIPHTHDDLGWLKTGELQSTLENNQHHYFLSRHHGGLVE